MEKEKEDEKEEDEEEEWYGCMPFFGGTRRRSDVDACRFFGGS